MSVFRVRIAACLLQWHHNAGVAGVGRSRCHPNRAWATWASANLKPSPSLRFCLWTEDGGHVFCYLPSRNCFKVLQLHTITGSCLICPLPNLHTSPTYPSSFPHIWLSFLFPLLFWTNLKLTFALREISQFASWWTRCFILTMVLWKRFCSSCRKCFGALLHSLRAPQLHPSWKVKWCEQQPLQLGTEETKQQQQNISLASAGFRGFWKIHLFIQ